MKIVLASKKECTGCSACMSICPHNAIRMTSDPEGFLVPVIDSACCTQCGLCVKTCPVINSVNSPSVPVSVCAAMHIHDEVRLKSSSGGVFSAIAESILAEGGVVFGAGFDAQFSVRHISVEYVDQLDALQGSKYVQSDLAQAFREVRGFLKAGRCVLFTGTPCQIAGLKRFLGFDISLLTCIDLICYGVPSPLTWRRYLDNLSALPSWVHFRDKRNGWYKSCLTIDFAQAGKSFSEPVCANLYTRAYFSDYGLRRSCYNCKFKQGKAQSDLTIGDFWGVEHIAPELDDNKGISIVVAHTNDGRNVLEHSALKLFSIGQPQATHYNPMYVSSVHAPIFLWRWWFFRHVRKGEFASIFRILKALQRWKRLYHRGKGKLKLILRNRTGGLQS